MKMSLFYIRRIKISFYRVERDYLYFVGYKNHIGFYPVYVLTEIEDEMSSYQAKVQFAFYAQPAFTEGIDGKKNQLKLKSKNDENNPRTQ